MVAVVSAVVSKVRKVRKPNLALSRFALWLEKQARIAPKRLVILVLPTVIAVFAAYALVGAIGHAIEGEHLARKTAKSLVFTQQTVALGTASFVFGLSGLWVLAGKQLGPRIFNRRVLFAVGIMLILPGFGWAVLAFIVVALLLTVAPYGVFVAVPMTIFYGVILPLSHPAARRMLIRAGLPAAAQRASADAARISDWD